MKKKREGQAMIISILFFVMITSTIIFGLSKPLSRELRKENQFITSAKSLYAAEASLEETMGRLNQGYSVSSETLQYFGHPVTLTVTNTYNGKDIAFVSNRNDVYRKINASLVLGTGGSFNYGVQAGDGGLFVNNNSIIYGNVYSNGPIKGASSNNDIITGDAVSVGPAGIIEQIRVEGNAYAHTVKNASVVRDAYYQVRTNTTVSGTAHPNSPDQESIPLPISDEQIDIWKTQAASGGTLSGGNDCNYVIETNVTIGPTKVLCRLKIRGSPTVTLAGNVWVDGEFVLEGQANLVVSPALSGKSVVIIADDPEDRLNGSQIHIQNQTTVSGSGENSYVLFISQNNAYENGGGQTAIAATNKISGDVALYAPHGQIEVRNKADIKEVSGYYIKIVEKSEVNYETGVQNMIFAGGPAGGYNLTSWHEVK